MENRLESGRDWLDQARFTLVAAENFLAAGLFEEVISNSFLAMLYAARAALYDTHPEFADWRDVVRGFQEEPLQEFGLSKESQRSLPIVARLCADVLESGVMEADPVTATACLEDARSFISELGHIIEGD